MFEEVYQIINERYDYLDCNSQIDSLVNEQWLL